MIYVEARGDFLTIDGRSYRNVYLIKLVFDDAGAVTRIEEWTNPVTASLTWGFSTGASPRNAPARLTLQAPVRKQTTCQSRQLDVLRSSCDHRKRAVLCSPVTTSARVAVSPSRVPPKSRRMPLHVAAKGNGHCPAVFTLA